MDKIKRQLIKIMLACLMVLAIGALPKNEVSAETKVTETKIGSHDWVAKFSEGLAVVENYKYGYINTKGKTVISCNYDYVNCLKDGCFYARKNNTGYLIKITNK